MTERRPVKPMQPVTPAPAESSARPAPPTEPAKPYKPMPKPPMPPVMPLPQPPVTLPTHMYCDPQMLRQLYHQMKICHRYEREMLKWYMRYCAGTRRRPFFGAPCDSCRESSAFGSSYHRPHSPFHHHPGYYESSSSSRYWESSS
ncbi:MULTISPECIES: hypothetical protein [unclassified Thermoactinomyces]|jgi:hypothetical protein|uniref:hypothetical protein n=1 Tax=unclassified Thermoactinomyces TaxID=2634588 RepID=UPI0018DE2882|nr:MULTISPECIES: hypothetical protein [unclassified Thermoactinomyces]MBH8598450.1 hypothetical protein [Thermoactinomyces sp. CICC 10523]MBH8604705.1 hypothetical protein [Thermoactinomyces sp. CICC 10522]MBH8606834.1 hypothetical protein [Thermoactinomyces sp. CICC 10521]